MGIAGLGVNTIKVLLELYWKFVLPCWPAYEEFCWNASPPGKVVLVAWTFGALIVDPKPVVGNMLGTKAAGGEFMRGGGIIGGTGIGGMGKLPNIDRKSNAGT